MQFIANGPDIPEPLLQTHEEGRVVFFCGAGISYPAGLPGFKGLVDEIYRRLSTTLNSIEKNAYDRGDFDATLSHLERRLPEQRSAMLMALAEALQPELQREGALETHCALLELARNRKETLHLVTTNFDRVFDAAAKHLGQAVRYFSAPMLPVPKCSRWNGLVYLHGLLTDPVEKSELDRLVVTSGDFGRAYLTERWAARFVSELFRNYVVCFVGYSLGDPVLRYMMDALAADRMVGERTPQTYALVDCIPGHEKDRNDEWKAKGISSPILYQVPAGSTDHSALHRTLKAWAETYRDGALGKERIVVEHALSRPSGSTQQDEYVGRMLWALADKTGLPAKRFATFNPAPSLDWLKVFSENRCRHDDLARYGVPPHAETDDRLAFSLLHRPAPYTLAPFMALVSDGPGESAWDSVMEHLARWLVRHLNDPNLILWLAERGGALHDSFSYLINQALDKLARLEREGDTAELENIRANAPNAIPGSLTRTLWRLLLTGRVKPKRLRPGLYDWETRLKRDGMTATLRLELRELLAPKIVLAQPFRWDDTAEETDEEPLHMRQLVNWQLTLTAEHVRSFFRERRSEGLAAALDDFQTLLRDALDLRRELGDDDDRHDRSSLALPSISPHPQNGYHLPDWVALIELLRDAWTQIRARDPRRAARIAQGWFDLPYVTFKRLALFAARHDGCIASEQWVKWLLADDAWWLWSTETQRETMRLLVLQGRNLSRETLTALEAAILAGPPRNMYRGGIASERWTSLVNHSVWLHLAKLREGSVVLQKTASEHFDRLSDAYPEWRLASDERDEFSVWMSGTGDSGSEADRHVNRAPRRRQDLVEWLKRAPEHSPYDEDDGWDEICCTRFFLSLSVLRDLAREDRWLEKRWRTALQAWSKDDRARRSWQYAASLVKRMPDTLIKENMHSMTWWLESVSESIACHETTFLELCRRILAMPHRDDADTNRPVESAINHPVGHVTEALFNLWFRRKPSDNDRLPCDIEPLFTRLCDVGVAPFRNGRVLLASRLIALFRVDRPWTERHLLPLFDWSQNATEAKAAWEGFLWSLRIYHPLLGAFKQDFLSTVHHYEELGEHRQRFAAFLTLAALNPSEDYTPEDFQNTFRALPGSGLEEAAQTLVEVLESSGEQRENYWRNHILPFWRQIWPKYGDRISDSIAKSLARLCVAAREEFPSALSMFRGWLRPIEQPDLVVLRLQESDLASRFPGAALDLLDLLLSDRSRIFPDELNQCLDSIGNTSPELRRDPKHRRLSELVRRQGAS